MSNAPHSIGIIMDGNRRWARERGLPVHEGHRRGFEKVKELLDWAGDAGVREVTLYAFSTENWDRAEEEVGSLMRLFEDAFASYFEEVMQRGIRLRFIGQRDRMPARLRALMDDTEAKSAGNIGGTFTVAVSYGGRAEILDAVNTLLAREDYEQVTEEELRSAMWSAGLADPDLIIRTGGEKRLSNFLTWQSVYSELFFLDTYWPDFGKEQFDAVLAEYAARERRHGK